MKRIAFRMTKTILTCVAAFLTKLVGWLMEVMEHEESPRSRFACSLLGKLPEFLTTRLTRLFNGIETSPGWVRRHPFALLMLALACLWLFAVFVSTELWLTLVGRPAQAPGFQLQRRLRWVYSEKTVKRVFLPPIRDMQREHIEALACGEIWHSRWVLVRGYWSVWSAVVMQTPLSAMKRLFELWKAAS